MKPSRKRAKKWTKPYYVMLPFKVVEHDNFTVTYYSFRKQNVNGTCILRYTPKENFRTFLIIWNNVSYVVFDKNMKKAEDIFLKLTAAKKGYIIRDVTNNSMLKTMLNKPETYCVLYRG